MSTMIHFLLVYSYDEQRLIEVRNFADADEAALAYREAEAANRGKYDEFEIVLVGANSIETVKRTHGHYFMEPTMQEPFAGLLA